MLMHFYPTLMMQSVTNEWIYEISSRRSTGFDFWANNDFFKCMDLDDNVFGRGFNNKMLGCFMLNYSYISNYKFSLKINILP